MPTPASGSASFAIREYEELKRQFSGAAEQGAVTDRLQRIADLSLRGLRSARRIDLKSTVPGKRYFAFSRSGKLSRAVNTALFSPAPPKLRNFFDALRANAFRDLSSAELTKACYTAAMSFCCLMDLHKERDQKTPGTFFEHMMGHIFSVRLGVRPIKKLTILHLEDTRPTLPTDFLFEQGPNKPIIHLPVKTSTRERVIQVWAHQRVLEGVHGAGRIIGILACLAETKLDHKKRIVTEICLPEQWRVYQAFIAQMTRVYYLDVPQKYSELNNVFPRIHVRSLGDYFFEADSIGK